MRACSWTYLGIFSLFSWWFAVYFTLEALQCLHLGHSSHICTSWLWNHWCGGTMPVPYKRLYQQCVWWFQSWGRDLSHGFLMFINFLPGVAVIQFGQLTGNIVVRDKNKFRALHGPKRNPLLRTFSVHSWFVPTDKLIVKPKQLNVKPLVWSRIYSCLSAFDRNIWSRVSF